MIRMSLALAGLGLVAGAAIAQTDPQTGRPAAVEAARGYVGVPSPTQAATDAAQAPVTAALNGQVAAASGRSNAVDAAARAQYEADRAAYMDALVQHDRAVNRTDARYVRQQNAYADAMAVWRVQVDQCKKGHQKACDMPSPNPADYY